MSDPHARPGFLALLDESLAFSPERADLWMARFDALRLLGYKREFAEIVGQAVLDSNIRRDLDWTELRRMWGELAPGEHFPNDAEEILPLPAPEVLAIPDLPAPAPAARPAATDSTSPNARRFNDIATKIAGAELAALAREYGELSLKPGFLDDFSRRTRALLKRPTPLEYSERLSREAGDGMRLYLKREDRRGIPIEAEHAAAQCYIGSLLKRPRVVTANDVDLHALEVAKAASFFDLKCTIIVRPQDLQEKRDLVAELKALGATVEATPQKDMLGTDPREGALRVWQRAPQLYHLVLSLGMAPAPYTAMANAFQGLLGHETEAQYKEVGSLLDRPRTLVASVSSEADSLGFVLPFLNRRDIRIAYAEPEPGGQNAWRTSARLRPYHGQFREHSWLRGVGRIQHVAIKDRDAGACHERLCRDGINVGIEDARTVVLAHLLSRGDPTPRDFLLLLG